MGGGLEEPDRLRGGEKEGGVGEGTGSKSQVRKTSGGWSNGSRCWASF